jgi:ElaB/YqjD/DUF883 family membrane-anchored ribosome-binding protein
MDNATRNAADEMAYEKGLITEPDLYADPGVYAVDPEAAHTFSYVAPKEHPGIDHAAQVAHRAVDKAAEAAVPAASWLNEKSADARVKQKQWTSEARAYISANPMKGAGIAAAIGLVVGLIL